MAAEVPVAGGLVALVDAVDLPVVSDYLWSQARRGDRVYAQAHVPGSGDGAAPIHMHHLILPGKPGFDVDHRNRNGLDNRRENLRYATRSQNMANQKSRGGSSIYKGVTWDKARQRWRAQIRVNGKVICIGRFVSEEEAAEAYNAAAVEAWGEFAHLNDTQKNKTG